MTSTTIFQDIKLIFKYFKENIKQLFENKDFTIFKNRYDVAGDQDDYLFNVLKSLTDVNQDAHTTRSKKLEFIQKHLNSKFSSNKMDSGDTLLTLACKNGALDVVKTLLEINPSIVNQKDVDGYSALHAAAGSAQKEIVRFLLKQPEIDCNAQNANKDTPLHIACKNNDKKSIKSLLSQEKTSINQANEDGETAIFMLCKSGGTQEAFKLLRAKGAEVDLVNHEGFTPLMVACLFGNLNAAEWLLRHGADIKKTSADECLTILDHISADHTKKDIIELLIRHGASVSKKYIDNLSETLEISVEKLEFLLSNAAKLSKLYKKFTFDEIAHCKSNDIKGVKYELKHVKSPQQSQSEIGKVDNDSFPTFSKYDDIIKNSMMGMPPSYEEAVLLS